MISISPIIAMSTKIIMSLKIVVNKGKFSENVKDQYKSGKPKFDFNKRKSWKKKLTVIGDSIIKYLRRENLSSKK